MVRLLITWYSGDTAVILGDPHDTPYCSVAISVIRSGISRVMIKKDTSTTKLGRWKVAAAGQVLAQGGGRYSLVTSQSTSAGLPAVDLRHRKQAADAMALDALASKAIHHGTRCLPKLLDMPPPTYGRLSAAKGSYFPKIATKKIQWSSPRFCSLKLLREKG
jgi:hypothetical protein